MSTHIVCSWSMDLDLPREDAERLLRKNGWVDLTHERVHGRDFWRATEAATGERKDVRYVLPRLLRDTLRNALSVPE